MGGMVAQTVAIEHPKRVLSLTSIMSTTGKRSVGWQHPRLLPTLIGRRGRGRTAYAEGSAAIWALIGSPLYPAEPADTLAKANETFDRGWSAGGVLRQMLAVTTQENRSQRLHARARARPGRARHRGQDGARLRRPGDGRRHPRRRAAAHRRHGPRPAPGPLRDLRRRHPAYGRSRVARWSSRASASEHVSRPRESYGVSTRSAVAGLAARPATRCSVAEALARVGVEDVDVLRVGGDVDAVTLGDVVAAGDPDDHVGGGALDVAVAVDEAVGAELLDDGDVDREATLALGDQAPRLGAHAHGDVGVTRAQLLGGGRVDRHEVVADLGLALLARLGLDEVHLRRADEAGDEQVDGLVVELQRGVDLHQLAEVHHRDAVAHRHRLDLVVGHVDRRDTEVGLELGDVGAGLHAHLRVQVGQRLVHAEHLRRTHDRATHGHALTLTTGQGLRLALEVLGRGRGSWRRPRRASRAPPRGPSPS